MNRVYKILSTLAIFLSILVYIPIYSERPSIPYVAFSNNQAYKTDNANRIHSDFSYEGKRRDFSNHSSSTHPNNFKIYSAQDFQHHFTRIGYTESEILNELCLYMFDEFVKYAQTCSGYKDSIKRLYAELKNLNMFQKAYLVAKGKYCRGLQDRIAYLYKQINTIKAISQNNNFYNAPVLDKSSSDIKVASFDKTVLAEQFAEYKALESMYDAYTTCLAKAIKARSIIYQNIIDHDFALERVKKSYNLNNNIKQLLSCYGYELVSFTHCSGNQLQQVIHQESLDILDRIDSLPNDSVLYDHQEVLVDFAAAMADYNHAGLTDKAMTIADLCWTLLDYGQAIAEGVALGVYSAAHDILSNPIEATVCLVAGKQVLAYQLCKVLYNVADIGIAAIRDYDHAKEKWNKYAESLNNIIDAINKKEISVRDAIKGGTAFVVNYKAQGKLLGGLGKFCTNIQHKSINFVKNNSFYGVPIQNANENGAKKYLTTPEGLLFKAPAQSNKLKLGGQSDSATNLKNVIDNKVSKSIALPRTSTLGQGLIRNDLRAKIETYRNHIFSDDHKKRGILALGKSEEAIMDSLYNIIASLDKKGLLKDGPNQIKAAINGINNVEIRCFIQNGEAISANAYISDFGRIYGNFIDITKV